MNLFSGDEKFQLLTGHLQLCISAFIVSAQIRVCFLSVFQIIRFVSVIVLIYLNFYLRFMLLIFEKKSAFFIQTYKISKKNARNAILFLVFPEGNIGCFMRNINVLYKTKPVVLQNTHFNDFLGLFLLTVLVLHLALCCERNESFIAPKKLLFHITCPCEQLSSEGFEQWLSKTQLTYLKHQTLMLSSEGNNLKNNNSPETIY